MGAISKPNFTRELACRTKLIYYNYLRVFVPDEFTEHEQKEMQKTLDYMEQKRFDTTQRYEVSMLLNSLVGLLVFPEQAYYDEKSGERSFDKLPVLKRIINGKYGYVNTYIEQSGQKEEMRPVNIIRHMKNAVSHERIMTEPQSDDGLNITHVVFRDECWKKRNKDGEYISVFNPKVKNKCIKCRFEIKIPIKEWNEETNSEQKVFEDLVMEIADFLLRHELG